MMLATSNQPLEYLQMTDYPIDNYGNTKTVIACLRGRILNGKWRVKRSAWRADPEGCLEVYKSTTCPLYSFVQDFLVNFIFIMALVETPIDLPTHISHATEFKGPLDSKSTTVTVESDINGSISDKADTQFELEEHPVDVLRPIKVGIIGAGLAGITAGVMLPEKLPGLDLRIYDKNADVGGTW
jgi:hypothetical protein